MGKKKPEDRKVVRNRRVMIYTFLLIFMLLYLSAHFTVQERKTAEAKKSTEIVAEAAVVNGDKMLAARPEEVVTGDNAVRNDIREDGTRVNEIEESEKSADYEMEQQEELVIKPEDMWCLILTNAEYPVPEDYAVTLRDVPGTDQKVDERIYEPLINMLEAMKAEGLSPVVCSGYRTLDKQEKLFNRKVSAYVKRAVRRKNRMRWHARPCQYLDLENTVSGWQLTSIPGPITSWNGHLRKLRKENGFGNMHRIMGLLCDMMREKKK